MKDKVKECLEKNNFVMDSKGSYLYYKDYLISLRLRFLPDTAIYIFSHLEENEIIEISSYLKKQNIHYEISKIGILLQITPTRLDFYLSLTKTIVDKLEMMNIKNGKYCPVTGEILLETKKKIVLNNFIVFINEDSESFLNQYIQSSEDEFQSRPNRYLQGTIGSLIGGAIGCIIWVVVGCLFNVVSGIIAGLTAFFAGIGYDKMMGKPTNMKIIIPTIVTLIYSILSTIIIYIFLVKKLLAQEGLDESPILYFLNSLSTNMDFKMKFIRDLVVGFFFGGLGVFFTYQQTKRAVHKKTSYE